MGAEQDGPTPEQMAAIEPDNLLEADGKRKKEFAEEAGRIANARMDEEVAHGNDRFPVEGIVESAERVAISNRASKLVDPLASETSKLDVEMAAMKRFEAESADRIGKAKEEADRNAHELTESIDKSNDGSA